MNPIYRLFFCFCLILATKGFGQSIALYEQHNGRFDYTAIGNTLNINENGALLDCSILSGSSAELNLSSGQIVEAMLEDAWSRTVIAEGAQCFALAFEIDTDQFAWLDFPGKFCADDIERDGFAGKDNCIAHFSHYKRANGERIAACDHACRRHNSGRVGPLNRTQRVNPPVDHSWITAGCDEVDDHFGVGCGLENLFMTI